MNTPVQENAPVAETPKKGGGLVIAGFIMAILSMLICWFWWSVFVLWIPTTLALIFCIIGLVKKQKKVLAILGIVLSVVSWIIYYCIIYSAASNVASLY